MIKIANMWADLKDRASNGIYHTVGTGSPTSGTDGTGAQIVGPFSTYTNVSTGIVYTNEGTKASPYWTPQSFDQPNLIGFREDFRGGAVKAIADTTASANGANARVFGQGIAETDSGCIQGTTVEGSQVGQLTTTNEAAHIAAIGIGSSTVAWQPDTHGTLVIDTLMTPAAITAMSFFVGFLGTAADALDPPVTGSSTTLTLVQDDLCGMVMDAGLTDSDGLFAPYNKSNAAATIATSATAVDLSTTVAAGTYQRFRVEIASDGDARFFVDKAQVGSEISIALDVDEEVTPVLLVRSTTTATKTLNIKHVAAWSNRS